jgi:hypothetical protein
MKATSKTTTHRARTRAPCTQADLDQVKASLAAEHQARGRLEEVLNQPDDPGSPLSFARGLALAVITLSANMEDHEGGALYATARCLLDKVDQHIAELDAARDAALACGILAAPAVLQEAGA